MNFLEQIKDDLNNMQKRTDTRNQCWVQARSLRELIDHYETLDSLFKIKDSDIAKIGHYNVLCNLLDYFYKIKSPDQLMFMIMNHLSKRIEEKAKQLIIDQYESNPSINFKG